MSRFPVLRLTLTADQLVSALEKIGLSESRSALPQKWRRWAQERIKRGARGHTRSVYRRKWHGAIMFYRDEILPGFKKSVASLDDIDSPECVSIIHRKLNVKVRIGKLHDSVCIAFGNKIVATL